VTAVRADFANRQNTVQIQTRALAENGLISDNVHEIAQTGYERMFGALNTQLESFGQGSRLRFIRVFSQDKIISSFPDYVYDRPIPDTDRDYVRRAFRGETCVKIGQIEFLDEAERPQRGLAIQAYHPVRYRSSSAWQKKGRIEAVVMGGSIVGRSYLERLHALTDAQLLFYQDEDFVAAYPEIPEAESPFQEGIPGRLAARPDMTFVARISGLEHIFGGVPIRSPDRREPAGYFVLGVSRKHIQAIKNKTRENVLYVALLGAGLSLILASLVSLGITRPISELARSAQLIGRGRFYEARTGVTGGDEIGLLGDAMNKMIDDLKTHSERLALSERQAAWRGIARSIAHEIKNPLSPIQLSIENMRALRERNPEEFSRIFDEATTTVLEEVDKLRRLANEFSAFARMPGPQFEKVDVAEVVGNVVSLHAADAPGVRVSVTGDSGPGLFVRADRDQLNRVFTNLVKNALEAMPQGGDLTVILRRVNEEIFVVIEDSGVGMDADQLARIFTPYYTTKPRGSGLGLAMVQRILQDHGAGFDVYSEMGKGAKFIIAFKEMPEDNPAPGGPPHA
jgi:signal transduction histidine kinase